MFVIVIANFLCQYIQHQEDMNMAIVASVVNKSLPTLIRNERSALAQVSGTFCKIILQQHVDKVAFELILISYIPFALDAKIAGTAQLDGSTRNFARQRMYPGFRRLPQW